MMSAFRTLEIRKNIKHNYDFKNIENWIDFLYI